MNNIWILGLTHGLFGILLVSAKAEKGRADYLLIGWLFFLILPFVNSSGFIPSRLLNQSLTLLNGPLLFCYVREVVKQGDEKRDNKWVHFVPFLLIYLWLVIEPAPLTPGGPTGPIESGFSVFKYFGMLNLGVFTVYGVLSIGIIIKNNRDIKDTFAYRNGMITLLWLALLPAIFLLFFLTILIIEHSTLGSSLDMATIHQLFFLLFMLYLIFFGLKQQMIYAPLLKKAHAKKISSKRDEKVNILLEHIKSIMLEDKIYRDPGLSVYDLADKLEISRHQVSELLNEHLSLNFFQFVNNYRLQDVAMRLEDDLSKEHNILELAFDSGFNSKSSFNSQFKKQFNMTPSQYRASFIEKKV